MSKSARMMLYVLGGVIALCLVILAIDRFIVRRGEPSRSSQLAAAGEALGLQVQETYAEAPALMRVVARFAIAPPLTQVGAVMRRQDDAHTLIAYEHGYRDTAVHTDHGRHDIGLRLLGIVLHVPGASFPAFEVGEGGRLTGDSQAVPQAAIRRIASFNGDFLVAAAGEHLFMVQKPPRSALVAAMQQKQSPDFMPGLLNTGLKIDLQRALDVAGMLIDGPTLAPVYRPLANELGDGGLDVKVDIDIPKPDLKLDETVQKFQADLEALREEQRAQREALRKKHEVDRKARHEAFMERLRSHRHGGGDPAPAPDTSESPAPGARPQTPKR